MPRARGTCTQNMRMRSSLAACSVVRDCPRQLCNGDRGQVSERRSRKSRHGRQPGWCASNREPRHFNLAPQGNFEPVYGMKATGVPPASTGFRMVEHNRAHRGSTDAPAGTAGVEVSPGTMAVFRVTSSVLVRFCLSLQLSPCRARILCRQPWPPRTLPRASRWHHGCRGRPNLHGCTVELPASRAATLAPQGTVALTHDRRRTVAAAAAGTATYTRAAPHLRQCACRARHCTACQTEYRHHIDDQRRLRRSARGHCNLLKDSGGVA